MTETTETLVATALLLTMQAHNVARAHSRPPASALVQ